MAEKRPEKPEKKDNVRFSSSSDDEETLSEGDFDSSMTTSESEQDVDVHMEVSGENEDGGGAADSSSSTGSSPSKKGGKKKGEKKARAGRASRGRRERQEMSNRERQQRLLSLLLPPWIRMANRWAGGIASHTSRSGDGPSAIKRRREDGDSHKETENKDTVYERKFFWSCNKDSGFPNRVNHAVAGQR